MTYLMLNCDKATFLLSKKELDKLGLIEQIKLKIHLLSCKYCLRFAEQSLYITKQVTSISNIDPNNLKLKLSDDQKNNIQNVIDNQIHN